MIKWGREFNKREWIYEKRNTNFKSNNEVLSIYPLNAYEYISEAGQ